MDAQITVVIPTLNSRKTIEWTLFSLLNQEDCAVKIIVADSGSTDGTKELCEKWNIPTIYVPPGNMYRAINEGLRLAHTTWLGYVNSDDVIYPNSYSRMISYGDMLKADVVYGICDYIDIENRFVHSFSPGYPNELTSHFRCGQLSFAQPAAIFRDVVFNTLGGFDEYYSLVADLDYYLKAISNNLHFVYIKGPSVACFRIREGQLSRNRPIYLEELNATLSKYRKATILDKFITQKWRARNIQQYIVRILRRSQMTGKYLLARTLDFYEFQENEKNL